MLNSDGVDIPEPRAHAPMTWGEVVECPQGHDAARQVYGRPSLFYCGACGGVWRDGPALPEVVA